MSRSVAWRRVVGDAASWRQDQALNATMYILREIGPTGFLLKEEGENKKFKVYLGDPHKCNCSVFVKEKDVCKHICWLLLKKFRVPRHNPVSWQLGLVEREINEVLRGHLVNDAPRRAPAPATGPHRAVATAADGRAVLQQKEISEDDVCPICQEELLEKKLPVTFCKFGCGNSIHIKCMKVWAEHQKTQGEKVIKCPLCREDFGPFELLRQEGRNADQGARNSSQLDRHIWVTCRSCHTNPVIGKCYRCTSCVDFHLCQSCFNTPVHTEHSFQFRQKRNQRWRPAQRTLGSLPPGIISDLLSRDLSHGDYDLLLQLDSQPEPGTHSVPDEVLESFPLIRVRENSALLAPGVQCRMCLRGYDLGQHVRKLPCTHKFHRDCIDPWLLHSHVTCPVDGQTVWSPHQEQRRPQRGPTQVSHGSGSAGPRSHSGSLPGDLILEVPGLGLRVNSDTASTSWLPGGGIPGDSPAERVRPTIPNYRDGEIPTGLGGALFGLNGTSLIRNNSFPLSNIEDSSLGTRLLAKARLRRQKISQHLNSLHTDRIHLEPVAPSIPVLRELDNTEPGITIGWSPGAGETTVALGRPPHSAPEDQPNSANRGRSRYRTNRANSMPSVERGRHASLTRTRSTSRDRITQPLGTGLESMFLGSNPTESPPSRGLVRPPLHRPPPKPRRNRVPQDNSRTPNLGLEGNKIS